MVVTGPDGSILLWNAAAEQMYGWSAAEVVGRNIVEVTPSEQTTDAATQIMRGLRAGESWAGEFEVHRKDGSSFTALISDRPVLDEDGTLVAVVGISRDVTRTRDTIARLATSEHRFNALVDGSGELFAITDAAGIITFVTGPVHAMFGVEADALLGVSLFNLIQPDDRARADGLWTQRLATTDRMPINDFWIRRPDGSWLCLSLLVNNLLDDPAIGGIVVTARDVTDHKNLERARSVTSRASAALVLATTEADLFHQICGVIVSEPRYLRAAIALVDSTSALGVRVVAASDGDSGYFDALEKLADRETIRGPLATAIESHEIQVIHDVAALPETMPWRRVALDHGYRSTIVLPLSFSSDDHGAVTIYADTANVFTDDAIAVLRELADDLSYGTQAIRTRTQRSNYQARFEAGLEATVTAIATAGELRDPYTAGHQRRVAELAAAIATAIGLDPDAVTGITVAAAIHDIGKLALPAEILSKPGRLTDTEFALVKEHSQAGHDIVAGIDFPWPVAEMILQHHERLNGSGYPHGLHGHDISVGARVIAVADVVEAMHSHRPYRPGLGIETALHEIANQRDTLFDPDIVDACLHLFHETGFRFTT